MRRSRSASQRLRRAAVTVTYATANGTAIAGQDYTAKTGTVTIPAGATSATFSVPIMGDTVVEQDETFFVNLSDPSAGASLATSRASPRS